MHTEAAIISVWAEAVMAESHKKAQDTKGLLTDRQTKSDI